MRLAAADWLRARVPAHGSFGYAGKGALPGGLETTIGSVEVASAGMRLSEYVSILS